jgi:hypothetical protein
MDLQTASVAEAHPAETQWPEEELLFMRQAKPQIPPLFRKRRKFIAVLGSIQNTLSNRERLVSTACRLIFNIDYFNDTE